MLMGHCHLFPGGFGDDRRDEFGVPGTAEHLYGFMKACGFERAQVISPVENPADPTVSARIDGPADGIAWLLAQPHLATTKDAPLLPAAAIVPNRSDALEKLRRARGAGVRMLKFHPIIMRCDPLEAACAAFWREAAAARMPATYHTGGGGWGWSSDHARPQVAAELAGRFEGLPVVMAHCGVFGGEDRFEAAVAACLERPNLYLDTTAALVAVGPDRWKKALDLLGPQRVIYGNDYPWASRTSVEKDVAFIGGLGLSKAEKKGILGDNLMELWRSAAR